MATKLLLSGHVQGVFCRAYCSQYARLFGIHGSATNNNDGSVTVVLLCDDQTLIDRYAEALRTNPRGYRFFGHIQSILIDQYSGTAAGDYEF